jgi:hypothetical protein
LVTAARQVPVLVMAGKQELRVSVLAAVAVITLVIVINRVVPAVAVPVYVFKVVV